MQDEPRGTGDAAAAARDSLEGFDGDVLVVTGDAAAITRRAARPRSSRPTRRAAPPRTVLSFEPADPGAYGRIVRDARRRARRRSSRPATQASEELALREVNSSIYVFEAAKLWPALERLDPAERPGRALPDRHRPRARRGRRARRRPHGRRPGRGRGRQHARRARRGRGRPARPDQPRRTCSPARRSSIPATTWIDPTVELEPDCDDPPVHRPARRHARRPRRRGRPARRRRRRRDRPRRAGRPVLLPSPRNRAGGRREGRRVRGDQELAHRRTARRCHTSPTSETRTSARARTSAPGNITANYPHQPGKPKGRTTIGRNVRTGVHNAFVAPVEIGDDAWIGAGSVITEDVPPESLAVGAGAPGEQGRLRAEESGSRRMSEATLPGLETVEPVLPMTERTPWIERGPQKRLMLFSGRSNPELAEQIAEKLDVEPRRGRAEDLRERRDLRPLPTTRSAAATSSSSSRATSP